MRQIDKLKIEGEESPSISSTRFLLIVLVSLLGFSIFTSIFYLIIKNGAISNVLGGIVCIICYALLVGKNTLFNVFKKLKNKKTWIYGTLFGIILIVFNLLATYLLTSFTDSVSSNEEGVREMVLNDTFFSCIYVLLLAPFIEEFAYRFGVFGFLKQYKRWVTYLVSGLIFGFIHFVSALSGEINWIVEIFSLLIYSGCGLILCFAYDSTNSLMVSTLAHLLNNLVAVILLF